MCILKVTGIRITAAKNRIHGTYLRYIYFIKYSV
ncbi:hypothetical protein P879_11060 [Paragonimus westermani]|uniref:Uncharacterized protein n=1 Tax=Paragonimus westermani TaxID=34504 RepID=A0A8T0DE05_9TREM|nr:hypothetical protein P879_11060 [Paragonimus westermani]